MKVSSNGASRRNGVTAVHSLSRFVFSVPDLDVAERFYTEFGLDVRREGTRIDLHTFGHPHCWGSVFEVPGKKKLQYLSFGVYDDDLVPAGTPSRRHRCSANGAASAFRRHGYLGARPRRQCSAAGRRGQGIAR